MKTWKVIDGPTGKVLASGLTKEEAYAFILKRQEEKQQSR